MCSCREGGAALTDLPSPVSAKEREEEGEGAMEVLEGPQEREPDTSGYPMAAVIPDPDEQVGVRTCISQFPPSISLILFNICPVANPFQGTKRLACIYMTANHACTCTYILVVS